MSGRAGLRAILRGLACVALLAPLVGGATAQSVRVTSGEHEGFTRIVLQARTGFDWSLAPRGRQRALAIDAEEIRIDAAEIFRVIPRDRLADLTRTAGGLALTLNCDCVILTDEPGPGVVVLDIHDGPGLRPPARTRVPATASGASGDIARSAGGDLARRMRADASTREAERLAAEEDAARRGRGPLMEHLVQQMAQAAEQGLLAADIALDHAAAADPSVSLDLPMISNIRIADLPFADPDEPDDAGRAEDICPPSSILTFGDPDDARAFRERHASLMRDLFGEFDAPSESGHLALARLYLEHGFGAEARVVIENAATQIAGRDLLIGLSDIFEDRYSNARQRLAERVDCGGTLALFAALAGAEPDRVQVHGLQIARSLIDAPAPMQSALGGALIRRLLDAGARDPARMVAEMLRRRHDLPEAEMVLIDALLDAARGDVDGAAARLDHGAAGDADALAMRLRLALERDERVESGLLADAEALAASERTTPRGIELMALAIRSHNLAEGAAGAFAALDRLERWLAEAPSDRAPLPALRAETWASLANNGDDRVFLMTFVDRDDWRGADLSNESRVALSERLVGFGLTEPAAELLRGLRGEPARILRARIALLGGNPAGAVRELAGIDGETPEHLRAQAERVLSRQKAEAAIEGVDEPDAFPAPEAGPSTPPEEPGLMLRSETLLSESARLRDALDAVLRPSP